MTTGPSAAWRAAPAAHGHDDSVDVPRGALLSVAALLLLTLLTVAAVRWLDDGSSPSAPRGAVLAERSLRFADLPGGGIAVRDAVTGQTVREIDAGSEPFVRGALRALVRERRSHSAGAELPFTLQARDDGRLSLLDPATGRRLDIESFGPSQSIPFARLLQAPR